MKYYHFHNDISLEISLKSVTTDLTIDASMIKSIQFFTRKNGATYKCCFGNNTLINNGDTVTAVLNNHCLEPGVLQYVVEFQIPDSTYPDYYKKIHQYYATEIELVKGNGETEIADVQAMFGSTIDGKFNDLEAEIDDVSEDVEEISASIVSIQELNSVQDASINRIEDIISTIDGGTSGSIDRLDTSVNALQSDVSALNSSVSTLTTEQETMSQNLSNVTNTVNDVSTRVDGFESALANKADVSVLSNYYTTGETYTKSEVDRAIADAALDGELPAGVVVDANYVHTDNNYSNEDKAKVRDFDLTGYPTNSSLVANYATKSELQNVDDNHPTNASVNATYLKKTDLAGELTDYPTNSSVVANYAKKNDISTFVNMADVSFWVSEEGFITGNDVSQFVTDDFVNLNYVSWENLDEAVFNMIDNNYDVQWKVQEIVNDSSTISDISTNVSDVSIKVDDVSVKVKDVSLVSLDISTRLNNDYLTAQIINRDFVKNASLNDYVLNSSLSTNYTTKSEFNEVWETFVTADYVDETYAKIIDVSNHLTTNDISTFKPIVFCTQEEYDDLVENDQVDANTVYMLSGDQTGGDYLTPDDVSNFVTTNDVSNFVTNDDLQDELDYYTKTDDLIDYYVLKENLDNDVSALGYLKSNDVSNFVTTNDISTFVTENDASNYLQKNTDIEVNSVQFTDNNTVTSYLNIDKANSNNSYILSIGLPDTDAGGELTDREVLAARSIYNGDSEQTELSFGQTSTWAIFGNNNKNTKIQGLNVSIGKTTGNVEILGQNVSIGGRNVNDFITSNDVSVYATTSYVDTQIGNIQNILQTI